MKKVGFSLLILLLIPLNIFACPHVDSNGKAHLQTYNDSYTIMNMIYPMDDYLYIKEVPMDIQSQVALMDENEILLEIFSFPIVMDKATFMTYYWFLDDSLTDPANADKEVQTTVEGIEKLNVAGQGYNLTVNFNETYDKGLNFENKDTQEIYYDIIVEDMSEDNKTLATINNYSLNVLSTEIIDVDARFNVTDVKDYKYETYYEEIKELSDDVIVKLKASTSNSEVVAINLDKKITNDSFIPTVQEGEYYTFNTKELGTYILTEKIFIEEIVEETTTEENKEETKANVDIKDIKKEDNNYIIYLVSGIIIFMIILLLTIRKKRK